MRSRLPFLLPVLAASLGAQTAVMRALMDRDRAAAEPPAILWVVDAQRSHALADAFASLLAGGALRNYGLPVRAFTADSPAGREALARHGLGSGPQWFLVDTRSGTLRARGAALPAAEAFAQTLEQCGFRDRAKELEAYLRRNPDSLEAQEQLLAVLRARGEAAAQRALGITVPSARERLERGEGADALEGAVPPADLSRAHPMSPLQDLEAWSAFAQAFDMAFRSGRWRELDLAWTREGRPLDAASPTLQGLYLRWMPTVEDALREDPSSESLWSLWGWMSEATGGRRLRALMASLRPSPLTPPAAWPPPSVARMLLATAASPEDWRALKAHYQAVWEDGFHPLRERPVEQSSIPWETDWAQCLSPLLECCLRAGALPEAEARFREAATGSRWPELPARASALARRCGQPALATRWAAIGSAR